jgi:hypothetical protein
VTTARLRLSGADALVGAIVVAAALLLHARLIARLADAIAGDIGDPLLNVWILWWNARHAPWSPDYWHAPAFAPAPYALALSETLLGLTWATTPLQWAGVSPLAAYNLLFAASPCLNGIASYALCRALTGRRDAALAGALYFAFAPYRAGQVSHLQTTATFWMPIALLGLHRFWTTGRWRWLAVMAVASALNGLVSGYHLLFFPIAVVVVVAGLGWATRAWARAGVVLGVFAGAMLALAPVLLVYRRVHRHWGFQRGLEEMADLSADLTSMLQASSNLAIPRWPAPFPKSEADVYPGLVFLSLMLVAAVVAWRRRDRGRVRFRFLRLRRMPDRNEKATIVREKTEDTRDPIRFVRWTLWAVSAIAALVAGIGWVAGPLDWSGGPLHVSVTELFKPFGLALTAALFATACSPGLNRLLRSGSLTALYASLWVITAILMLGPEAQVLGIPVWYKSPFAWLVELPGFDAVRVPARLATVQVLAGGALAALVLARLFPRPTPRAAVVCAAIGMGFVLDGWHTVPLAALPPPLPAASNADLLVELPTHGWVEDVPAMYRGIAHGRRVVNGYSGYLPPHYLQLHPDLDAGCLESLDATRRGRSLDVVIWLHQSGAADLLAAAAVQWPGAARDASEHVALVHVPADRDRAETAFDDPIELGGFCEATRTSPTARP